MATVYSRLPTTMTFTRVYSHNHSRDIVIKGMSSFSIAHDGQHGYPNEISDEDWQWINDNYNNDNYPNLFCKFTGDNLYVASNVKDAKAKHKDAKEVATDDKLLSKTEDIEELR